MDRSTTNGSFTEWLSLSLLVYALTVCLSFPPVIHNYVHVALNMIYSTMQTFLRCGTSFHFLVCLLFLCFMHGSFPLFVFDMTHGQCMATSTILCQTLRNQDKLFESILIGCIREVDTETPKRTTHNTFSAFWKFFPSEHNDPSVRVCVQHHVRCLWNMKFYCYRFIWWACFWFP